MIDWYIKCRHHIRAMHTKAVDALRHCEDDETQSAKTIASYMKTDFQQLRDHWHTRYPEELFGYLGRHIAFAEKTDFNDIIKHDLPAVAVKLDQLLVEFERSLPIHKSAPYVAEERIEELAEIEMPKFSTAKLIRLLRELNIAYNNDSHFAVGILVRAIIDHIPPIFSCTSFAEVANNYKGTKSFKGAMQRLNDSLRNLADSYLHVQIRKIESLPTVNQVDFRAELDALLSEVSRLLQDV
ncbi:MAG: hypothetical protein RIQ60_3718 [Pseudomonadota bacterium]|jgi:hypothetical protein